jgi:hypothetical protein
MSTPDQTLVVKPTLPEVLAPAIERAEAETGEAFSNWYQALQGEEVAEFTDIKWTTVQMLCCWSHESGVPFETCVRQFLLQFRLEVKNVRAQRSNSGCGILPLEHWRRQGFLTPKEQKLYDDPTVYSTPHSDQGEPVTSGEAGSEKSITLIWNWLRRLGRR